MPSLKQGFYAERGGFNLNFKFCGSSATFQRWPRVTVEGQSCVDLIFLLLWYEDMIFDVPDLHGAT